MFEDFGIQIQKPVKLMCDNQSAIYLTKNPIFHERTKHVEVDCHYVREKVEAGVIEMKFIKSGDQLADVFTKAVSGDDIARCFPRCD